MDEEEAILSSLIDWVAEILPIDFNHEISNKQLRIFRGSEWSEHADSRLSISIKEEGIVIDGNLIIWSRDDIQREFQRSVLVGITKIDPSVMFNNPKFAESWRHIITQDVSR